MMPNTVSAGSNCELGTHTIEGECEEQYHYAGHT